MSQKGDSGAGVGRRSSGAAWLVRQCLRRENQVAGLTGGVLERPGGSDKENRFVTIC